VSSASIQPLQPSCFLGDNVIRCLNGHSASISVQSVVSHKNISAEHRGDVRRQRTALMQVVRVRDGLFAIGTEDRFVFLRFDPRTGYVKVSARITNMRERSFNRF